MLTWLKHFAITTYQMMICLLDLKKKDFAFFERINSNFDFNELVKLHKKDPITFKSILLDGYTVKFITLKGLQNLLKLKFDKIDERDYKLLDNGISHLTIDETSYPILKQMLSKNWTVQTLSGQDSNQSTKLISILPA